MGWSEFIDLPMCLPCLNEEGTEVTTTMNQLKTVLLLGILSAILVGVGGALGPNALGIGLALAVVMNVGAYFFSDRIVLAMHRAQEISPAESPELHRMVEELAARAGIPEPRLYLIPETAAERLRHRAQPGARRGRRHLGHSSSSSTGGSCAACWPTSWRP